MNEKELKKIFEQNNIEFLVFQDPKQAIEYIVDALPEGCTFSTGGSVTLSQIGLVDELTTKGYCYSNDTTGYAFFCSANAITEDGLIVNVDRSARRISAIAYGPPKVFVLAGNNKIVEDYAKAIVRIKSIAAPKNAHRLGLSTPCANSGVCCCMNSNLSDGCNSADRLCCQYLITSYQRIRHRITILIINSSLGY